MSSVYPSVKCFILTEKFGKCLELELDFYAVTFGRG
jgi:hypothetical protein